MTDELEARWAKVRKAAQGVVDAAPAALEAVDSARERYERHKAELNTTRRAYFFLGAAAASLIWLLMTGCAGGPYLQVNADYDWIDHQNNVTFSEGVGARVEAGWNFGSWEAGVYHFSHPFSHRNEVAVNGITAGYRWERDNGN